jgi:hypothetical protein
LWNWGTISPFWKSKYKMTLSKPFLRWIAWRNVCNPLETNLVKQCLWLDTRGKTLGINLIKKLQIGRVCSFQSPRTCIHIPWSLQKILSSKVFMSQSMQNTLINDTPHKSTPLLRALLHLHTITTWTTILNPWNNKINHEGPSGIRRVHIIGFILAKNSRISSWTKSGS